MESEGASIRLLLVADDPLVRGGLQALATGDAGLVVVAQVGTDEVSAALAAHAPDAVLWDAGLDPAGTLARLPGREAEAPPSLVLLPDERFVSAAVAAGARGILAREVSAARLGAALRAILLGLFVADELFGAEPPPGARARSVGAEELTARELEVLPLLAEGLSNKQIAGRLGISEHTAKFHVNSLLQKLGAQSRTDVVVKAARLGLLVL